MISYYKGQFINRSQVPINDNLFLGFGIFETIKFINKQLCFFDDHIDRLFSNNQFFNFSRLNKNEIYEMALETIKQNSLDAGVLKIIFVPINEDFSDLEYYIFIRELPQINNIPVQVKFYSELQYPLLRFNPGFKSLFYMGNMLAIKDAKSKGAFEPIFYNSNSIITDGAIRNIFFIKNTILYTPNLDLGILGGITRAKVLEIAKKLNYSINTKAIKYADINNMDEAFLTSSSIGVMPCYWHGWSSDYSITLDIKNHYNQMVKIQ